MTVLWFRLVLGLLGVGLATWKIFVIAERAKSLRERGFNGEIAQAFRGHRRMAAVLLLVCVIIAASAVDRQPGTDRVTITLIALAACYSAYASIEDVRRQEVLAADRLQHQPAKAS